MRQRRADADLAGVGDGLHLSVSVIAGPPISSSRWTLPVSQKWNVPVPAPTDIRSVSVPPLRCSRPTWSMTRCISQARGRPGARAPVHRTGGGAHRRPT